MKARLEKVSLRAVLVWESGDKGGTAPFLCSTVVLVPQPPACCTPPLPSEPELVAVELLGGRVLGFVHVAMTDTLQAARSAIVAAVEGVPLPFVYCLEDGVAVSEVQERRHPVGAYMPRLVLRPASEPGALPAGATGDLAARPAQAFGDACQALQVGIWGSALGSGVDAPSVSLQVTSGLTVQAALRDACSLMGVSAASWRVQSSVILKARLCRSTCASRTLRD